MKSSISRSAAWLFITRKRTPTGYKVATALSFAGWVCCNFLLITAAPFNALEAQASQSAEDLGPPQPGGAIVSTNEGPVQGIQTKGITEFLGIPYAAAAGGQTAVEATCKARALDERAASDVLRIKLPAEDLLGAFCGPGEHQRRLPLPQCIYAADHGIRTC